MIAAAHRVEDLRSPPGNRLERLRGDRDGHYSIRINDQLRICFRWNDGAEDVEIDDYRELIKYTGVGMSLSMLPPIHPGEILREEFMHPLGLSSNALARRLGVTPARVNDLVLERRGITADTALRLARCFSTTGEFWMNLQIRYELETARREVGTLVEQRVEVMNLDGHGHPG
jgi:addiction module HigA family antidote